MSYKYGWNNKTGEDAGFEFNCQTNNGILKGFNKILSNDNNLLIDTQGENQVSIRLTRMGIDFNSVSYGRGCGDIAILFPKLYRQDTLSEAIYLTPVFDKMGHYVGSQILEADNKGSIIGFKKIFIDGLLNIESNIGDGEGQIILKTNPTSSQIHINGGSYNDNIEFFVGVDGETRNVFDMIWNGYGANDVVFNCTTNEGILRGFSKTESPEYGYTKIFKKITTSGDAETILWETELDDNTVYHIKAFITGRKNDTTFGAAITSELRFGIFRLNGGAPYLFTPAPYVNNTVHNCAHDVYVNQWGNYIKINVKGDSGATSWWTGYVEFNKVSTL